MKSLGITKDRRENQKAGLDTIRMQVKANSEKIDRLEQRLEPILQRAEEINSFVSVTAKIFSAIKWIAGFCLLIFGAIKAWPNGTP